MHIARRTTPLLLSASLALPALILSVACEPGALPRKATSPQTSRLQISKDGKTLYVALADHDLVRAVDATTGDVRGEVRVDGHPHRITVMHDGRVAVTARDAGTLSIVDVEKARVDASVNVGAEPWGVVEKDGALFVAIGGEAELVRVDESDATHVAAHIALGHADPRGLLVDAQGHIVVTHFTAGVLTVVDASTSNVRTVDMRLPSKAFFFPNQMESATLSVDGGEIAVPHVECNNDPAQFGANGTPLTGAPPPTVTYYVQGPTGYPAVVPAVSHVDPTAGLVSDENRSLEEASGETPEQAGAAAPVLNPLNRNLLGQENLNGPTEIAWVDDGNLQLVVARGSGNVFVRRPTIRDGEKSIDSAVHLDVGAEAIQISPDGNTAYVYNAFDDSIASFPVPRASDAESKFASQQTDDTDATNLDPNTGLPLRALHVTSPSTKFTVAAPALSKDVREGRVLFYAADDRLTHDGAISCQSCHPNGAADGTTWHFQEGPRNSPALWGGITQTAPFHWDASVQDITAISEKTIVGRMGGTGLDSHAMNQVGAFLDAIPVPAAPAVDEASAVRGKAIFESSEANCVSCHSGPMLTDNKTHDLPTIGDNEPGIDLIGHMFATPSLRGLAYTAPYLHNGSAKTLRDLVDRFVATDVMGHGSQLSEQDKDDLVAYLKTL